MARKTYNDEFKTAAAKLVREQGYSIKKAAESLGVDAGGHPHLGPIPMPRPSRLRPTPRPSSSSARTPASARRTASSSWSARF